GLLYARAQVVTVTRKPAKPNFLNLLKPLYEHSLPTLERARAHLAAGRSVGIFPEGEVNRDPTRLLRGRRGAARWQLETAAPAVARPGWRLRRVRGWCPWAFALQLVRGEPAAVPVPWTCASARRWFRAHRPGSQPPCLRSAIGTAES